MAIICKHIEEITALKQDTHHVCEECIKIDGKWVHLRICQTCGATLCCDSSPHKHMTKHFHRSDHPVVISAETGERWMWCYKDEAFAEY